MKHGLYKHPIYHTWTDIVAKCYSPNDNGYRFYGAKGITICDKWRHNFQSFFDYVTQLENYGKPKYTLDRINTYGNYEPDNLRWADKRTQTINQRIRSTNTTGYVGVSMVKANGKFLSRIGVNYKQTLIGRFGTPIAAAKARDQYIIDNELWEYPLQVLKLKR